MKLRFSKQWNFCSVFLEFGDYVQMCASVYMY